MNLLDTITAVIAAEPRLAEYFSRSEIERELQSVIDKMLFIGVIEERSGDRE